MFFVVFRCPVPGVDGSHCTIVRSCEKYTEAEYQARLSALQYCKRPGTGYEDAVDFGYFRTEHPGTLFRVATVETGLTGVREIHLAEDDESLTPQEQETLNNLIAIDDDDDEPFIDFNDDDEPAFSPEFFKDC